MHKNSVICVPNAIDPDICDEIVRLGELIDEEPGSLDIKRSLASTLRDSRVSWFTEEQGIKHNLDFSMTYQLIYNKVHEIAATQGWGDWAIQHSQAFQYTKYGPGGHYHWHPDTHADPYDQPGTPDHGLIRKLSMTLLLNDPSEYTGGDFVIEGWWDGSPAEMWHRINHTNRWPENTAKGTMIVFPSYCWHMVKPVQSGVRKSLVAWFLGPPWV